MSDGTVKIGVEFDTSNAKKELNKELNNVVKDNRKTYEQISKETGKSINEIKSEVEKLAKEYQKQGTNIPLSYKKAYKKLGILAKSNSKEIEKEAEKISDSYEKSSNKISNSLGKAFAGLGSISSLGISGAINGIKAFAGTTTAAVGGLTALSIATTEYRDDQAKLNSAFQTAGYSVEVAKQSYNDFYAILGESDTSVEASQLLAKLSLNQQDMSKWTNIAAGVWATYGDALPIEGLIESANETAKVGEVTGSLADALNWAGISEDEFNKKLANAGSEAERNQLIMQTLSGEYQNAANIFKENNKTIMEARVVQAKLMESLGGLGEAVNNISNQLLIGFAPSITAIVDAFINLINGIDGADKQLTDAISGFITKLIEQLPQFLEFGSNILLSLINGIIENLPQLGSAALKIIIGLQEKIIENLPTFISTSTDILESLSKGITENLPIILKNGNEIIIQLVNGLINNLPLIINTGIDILLSLVESLVESLPILIPAGVQAIITIAESLIDNLDKIIDAAIDLILALAFGLIDAIPLLIEKVPIIISKIVKELIKPETRSKLINAGIQLILALTEGLFKMNIALLQAGLNIVKELANSIINSPKEMIKAGKDLIRGLINGVKSMVSDMRQTMKNFVSGVINDVKSFFGIHSPSRVFRDEIGKMLVAGTIVGVESENNKLVTAIIKPYDEISNKLNGKNNLFSNNIVNLISESRKKAEKEAESFSDVGSIISDSVLESVNINKDNLLNSISKNIEEILNKNIKETEKSGETLIKNYTKKIESESNSKISVLEKNAENLINSYTKKIEQQVKNSKGLTEKQGKELIKSYTDSIKKKTSEDKKVIQENAKELINTYSDSVKEQVNAEKDALKNSSDELLNIFKNSIETGVEEVNKVIDEKIVALTNNYQQKFDDLVKMQQDLENKLDDTKLFDFEDDELIIEDLDSVINKLEEYDKVIAKLKEKGISNAILGELSSYSVEEVLKISEKLLQMTDKDFQKLNDKWQEKQELATQVASNFYKEQMEVLEKDFNDEFINVLNELPIQLEEIGIMTMQGFQNGINSKIGTIKDNIKSFSESIITIMQSALDIHSPSRKTEWMGKMLDEGFIKGIESNKKGVLSSIKNLGILDAFTSEIGYIKQIVSTGINNMLPKSSHIINNNSTKNITNNQGDLIFNISGFEYKGNNNMKTMLEEAAFFQKQREYAKGGV